jgi:hypothetical protein
MAQIEAHGWGLPIWPVPLRRVVRDGETGVLLPESPAVIAATLRSLASDRAAHPIRARLRAADAGHRRACGRAHCARNCMTVEAVLDPWFLEHLVPATGLR